MRHNRLDLNLLVALRALLRERNVTKAGQAIHVSQSAMSGILGRLRDYFDDPLIVPTGKKMSLTPLAESLLGPISDVLVRIDAAISTRPDFNPTTTRRHFSLVASDYAVSILLAPIVQQLSMEAPGLTLEILPPGEDVAEELEAGNVDFVLLPDVFASSQSRYHLFSDNFCLLVSQNSERWKDSITLEDYLASGHVAYQAARAGQPLFDAWFDKEYGNLRRVEIAVPAFQQIPQMLLNTDRIATVHTRLARQWAKLYPLRLLPVPFDVPDTHMVLQWHRYRDLDLASQWLRDRIVQASQTLPKLADA